MRENLQKKRERKKKKGRRRKKKKEEEREREKFSLRKESAGRNPSLIFQVKKILVKGKGKKKKERTNFLSSNPSNFEDYFLSSSDFSTLNFSSISLDFSSFFLSLLSFFLS